MRTNSQYTPLRRCDAKNSRNFHLPNPTSTYINTSDVSIVIEPSHMNFQLQPTWSKPPNTCKHIFVFSPDNDPFHQILPPSSPKTPHLIAHPNSQLGRYAKWMTQNASMVCPCRRRSSCSDGSPWLQAATSWNMARPRMIHGHVNGKIVQKSGQFPVSHVENYWVNRYQMWLPHFRTCRNWHNKVQYVLRIPQLSWWFQLRNHTLSLVCLSGTFWWTCLGMYTNFTSITDICVSTFFESKRYNMIYSESYLDTQDCLCMCI